MRLNKKLLPVGALTVALGVAGFSAEAAQQSDRRERRGQQSQGEARERSGGARDSGTASREQRGEDRNAQSTTQDQRGNGRSTPSAPQAQRGNDRNAQTDGRNQRAYQGNQRGDGREARGRAREWRGDERARTSDRRDGYAYSAPRVVPRRSAPRHYYGSGGNLSVYFGLGSGYRYGAPYSGRVYGYAAPSAVYGARRYYGDVRLQVRPRDAAVYVDGYYAGIVDNFDGVFQRLTLEAGPHEIEIEAPGLEPQVFDVYVDPTRTIDLRADLFLGRP
jgi:hypothetical protein